MQQDSATLQRKGKEAFSQESFDREDDEEALKWAALEKLPTYKRIRKGILIEAEGAVHEVEIGKLSLWQRKVVFDRVVRVADDEQFLQRLKNRVDRMTLLLGPPGSGKTTFLLALAGKLLHDLKVSGTVTYNGHGFNEFVPQRTAAYISQYNEHLGRLLELLKREKEAHIKPDPDLDLLTKAAVIGGHEADVVTDYVLKILGLENCADTIVGNQMLRGISGGEKKRVTTGEMMVSPAQALFMDEISAGLDSSTTFQIVKCIGHYIHIMGATALISLLQPSPETYELFDDIILLSEGVIVYQGPRANVLEFFESMGFKCPKRKGIADFLQEKFHVGRALSEELSIPFDKSGSHPDALTKSKYGASMKELLKATFYREILLMKRNSFIYIFKACQVSSLSIELGMTINKLPVFYKQRNLLFFPGWIYAIPSWILHIPISFLNATIWVGMTYYAIGLDPSFSRMFKQYMLFVVVNQMALSLFRFVGALARDMTIASTFGAFCLMAVTVLGGYILSRENVKEWWLWGYYVSPMMYMQNAISTNEFLGLSWNKILPGYKEPLGVLVLKLRGFFPEASWYWIGIGAMVGYNVLFNILFTFCLTYLNPIGKDKPTISEETLREKHVNLTGKVPQTISKGRKNSDDNSFSHDNKYQTVSKSTKWSWPNEIDGSSNIKKGMVLPFTPLSITFENIRYAVDMPQEMKEHGEKNSRLELLKGLNGSFRPGVLTALMGVSGAGKTTLMDVLAGRKTGGYIEGSIKISGYQKNQETFARISGYCEQNDIHSPHVTVYESLVFSAWLRLSAEVTDAKRRMFIKEVMELVELNSIANALVGMPGVNGLSTEQRKRLTIAVELVANPSIIFMDEPTSGLDARAAAIVMRTIRTTVDTGRTVVCTIHQPSIDIFEAFDELFLMKRGGEEIYVGPLGQDSCHLIEYFEAVKGVKKIGSGCNPATWMLEVTALAQERSLGVDFGEIYKKSDLYQRNKRLIKELSTLAPGSNDLNFTTQFSQPFLVQCQACLWKQNLSYWRNPSYTAIRQFFTTVMALFFGSAFWDLGGKRKKQQDLFNSLGSMYVSVMILGANNCFSVQPVVAIERTVFYRERAARMYSALPYALGQVGIEIPYIFVQSLVYGYIVYAMVGFEWTLTKFFWYWFFMYFTFLYYTFYGMMLVGLTPNYAVASIISSAFNSLWNLFSGYLIPRTKIPIWWRWFYWTCPVSWTLHGLVASQFGDLEDELDNGETVKEFIRSYFGFKESLIHGVAMVVIGFSVLFLLLFAYSIKRFNFQKR
ncbi:hypothetical protein LUZ61_001625 [Rhynchospora tenuis]|uniref:ABC transporter domain-containing protein n=1 Tax=Rhynchospora tenuis TaxID=198213 RepID=A0AAD5ZHH5_9POAL|nr:hypothetical protein LUZ61_001625 [Rhynchospora tenuis]